MGKQIKWRVLMYVAILAATYFWLGDIVKPRFRKSAPRPVSAQEDAAQPSQVFLFGVIPQESASKLARSWQPFIDEIEERTGLRMHLHTTKDIPTFAARLAAGEYDIAYMNPYNYVQYNKTVGYQAFAKEKEGLLQGVLVVRRDSPLRSVDELRGAEVAFSSPVAFAATILCRIYLARRGVDIIPKYVSFHDSVYRVVAAGIYPVGGGIHRTLQTTTPQIRRELRVLVETDEYTPHAFAVHPRVDRAVVSKVQAAMIAMSEEPEGRAILGALRITGIDVATDANWDDVRALDISKLFPDAAIDH